MRYEAHGATGFALGSLVYVLMGMPQIVHINGMNDTMAGFAVSAGLGIVGSLVPDMDIPESKASAAITMVSPGLIRRLIRFVAVGVLVAAATQYNNKPVFYALLGLFGVLFLGQAGISRVLLHYIRLALQYLGAAALVYFGITTGVREYVFLGVAFLLYFVSPHRGMSHALPLNISSSFVVYMLLEKVLPAGALVGAVAYLAGAVGHIYANDFFTDSGVPHPLEPFNRAAVWFMQKFDLDFRFYGNFLPGRNRFPVTITTGSLLEFGVVVLMATAGILLWRINI